ncbi:MAG: hypothetical protein M3422_07765 [Actinomycetota bacterium]|nr:hypothetical protein [Actinomycetota bacterium]
MANGPAMTTPIYDNLLRELAMAPAADNPAPSHGSGATAHPGRPAEHAVQQADVAADHAETEPQTGT